MNNFMIKDLPISERPRERLIKFGASNISNQELLAIVLRTGSKRNSAMSLAMNVLKRVNNLNEIRNLTIEELTNIEGIGPSKAVQIFASIELGLRINNTVDTKKKYSISSPQDCFNYIINDVKHLTQEHFICLFLNVKNEIISQKTIFIGSLNRSLVHPREVFKEAVKRSAASIICLHNHPSGDPTPSQSDINITKRLYEVGDLMGIDLLDHVVIGKDTYVSLKEKGLFV